MKQQTLVGFEKHANTTRRAHPKVSEAGGRPPLPLERMFRVYFLQLWFNLSDTAVEEELYDSVAMRNFAGN